MKELPSKSIWLLFIRYFWIWGCYLLGVGIGFGITYLGLSGPNGNAFVMKLAGIALNWLLRIIPIVILFLFFWAYLARHSYRYQLTNHGFEQQFGVIFKRHFSIPYNRIQNIKLYRSLPARILGLSILEINSPAVRAPSIAFIPSNQLIGIQKEEAERLRDELSQRMHSREK